ncbi:histidine phosphatase superfamily [Zopfochytrium polystomum]|nr:histidine phosphatase superfamily [Zopfochytrium polystomum]
MVALVSAAAAFAAATAAAIIGAAVPAANAAPRRSSPAPVAAALAADLAAAPSAPAAAATAVCPVNPTGLPAGILPVAAGVDAHLSIISTSPVRQMAASSKSRYPIPAAAAAPPASCAVKQLCKPSSPQTRPQRRNSPSSRTSQSPSPPGANAGLLTAQGVADHAGLARRLSASYSPLLADVATTSWQATNVSRALASGDSFADALYSGNPALGAAAKAAMRAAVVPATLDADLRPFDACAAYVNASAAAKAATPTLDASLAAKFFPTVAARLTAALGLTGAGALTADDVLALFSLCAFDNTLRGGGDAAGSVCGVFTDAELALYDLQQDLGSDVTLGYGLGLNAVLGCSLVSTFFSHMDAAVAAATGAGGTGGCGAAAKTAVLRFAHEETVMPVVTLLGLFGGAALGYDAGAATIDAVVAAAAGRPLRVAMVLVARRRRGGVRVLVNEVPVVVPGCAAELCGLEELRGVLTAQGKLGCDFDGKVCGNGAAGTVGTAATFRTVADVPIDRVKAAAGA